MIVSSSGKNDILDFVCDTLKTEEGQQLQQEHQNEQKSKAIDPPLEPVYAYDDATVNHVKDLQNNLQNFIDEGIASGNLTESVNDIYNKWVDENPDSAKYLTDITEEIYKKSDYKPDILKDDLSLYMKPKEETTKILDKSFKKDINNDIFKEVEKGVAATTNEETLKAFRENIDAGQTEYKRDYNIKSETNFNNSVGYMYQQTVVDLFNQKRNIVTNHEDLKNSPFANELRGSLNFGDIKHKITDEVLRQFPTIYSLSVVNGELVINQTFYAPMFLNQEDINNLTDILTLQEKIALQNEMYGYLINWYRVFSFTNIRESLREISYGGDCTIKGMIEDGVSRNNRFQGVKTWFTKFPNLNLLVMDNETITAEEWRESLEQVKECKEDKKGFSLFGNAANKIGKLSERTASRERKRSLTEGFSFSLFDITEETNQIKHERWVNNMRDESINPFIRFFKGQALTVSLMATGVFGGLLFALKNRKNKDDAVAEGF